MNKKQKVKLIERLGSGKVKFYISDNFYVRCVSAYLAIAQHQPLFFLFVVYMVHRQSETDTGNLDRINRNNFWKNMENILFAKYKIKGA